ncbi:MAG: hypothetical protein ACPGVI_04685 [Crocinitomicaceae bacterium]
MKYVMLVIGLAFCIGAFAQVEPFNVEIEEGGRLPEVFALGENQFTFSGVSAVDEALIIYGGKQWQIEKFSEGVFKVKCKEYGRSQAVELDSIIRLALKLNNGDSVNMTAPIRVYASVKIVPYGMIDMDEKSNVIPCEDKIGFAARWVYPSYVKRHWRVMVVFDIDVLSDGDRLMGFSGWYDSGDRSKMHAINQFAEIGDITVQVRSLKTLHRYSQNGVPLTIHLSEDYPNVWTLNCD